MPQTAIQGVAISQTTVAIKEVKTRSLLADLLGREAHESVNDRFSGMISELGKAKIAIDKKCVELNGAPGLPLGGVEYGAGDGYRRRYQNGIIYFRPPASPCWVHGAILDEYLRLGGEGGALGYPTTDELATPGGAGRYNHFQEGSIYWSYAGGAREVHGMIRSKWASLGWEQSWLGFPVSGELEYAEGGRVSVFEHGSIYWWPDTGAIDLGNVAVRFKGLYCFGRQSGIGPDHAYAILGFTPVPREVPDAVLTPTYRGIEDGSSRPDTMEIHRGIPGGIALSVSLYEADSGDPNKYLGLVKQGVALAGKGVSKLCGEVFGAEAVPICEAAWGAVAPEISSTVNDLLGTEDDLIGQAVLTLSAKEMVTTAGGPRVNFWGIEYQRESPLLSDGDASYKVYFDVERV